MANQAALYAVILILAAICVGLSSIGGMVVVMVLMIRPWDGNVRRDYSWTAKSPYPIFWLGTWIARAGFLLQSLKPGPLRATELATAYVLSQVNSLTAATTAVPCCSSAGTTSASSSR